MESIFHCLGGSSVSGHFHLLLGVMFVFSPIVTLVKDSEVKLRAKLMNSCI